MTYANNYARSDYDGAKALWLATQRDNLNVGLPLPTFWTLSDTGSGWTAGQYTAAKKRREILDTGFMRVHFPDSANQSLQASIDGYANVPAWVKANGAQYLIRAGVPNSTHKSGLGSAGLDYHPCYDGTNGRHIGADAGVSPCGPGVSNHIADAALRFQGSNGVAVDPPGTYGSEFLVPIMPETIPYWTACDTYIYRNHPTYGASILTKLRSTHGIAWEPVGFVADWEDFHREWNETNAKAAAYTADPRFAFSAKTTKGPQAYFWESLAAMIEARVANLATLCPWALPAHSIIYDLDPYFMRFGTWSHAMLKTSLGRRRGRISVYPFYGSGSNFTTFLAALSSVGNNVAFYSQANVHCFSAFFASTQNAPMTGGDSVDKPGTPGAGQGILSNAQAVGLCRLLMFLGAEQLVNYNADTASQDYWAMMIAYQEMQRYADLVRGGMNIVPPGSASMPFTRPDGTVHGHERTNWYALQSDGSAMTSGYYVCCRVLGGREYFFGMTANAAGNASTVDTVNVRSPSNRVVSVKVCPEGAITLA